MASPTNSPVQTSIWRTARALSAAENSVDRLYGILVGSNGVGETVAPSTGLCSDAEDLSRRADQLESRLQGLIALIEDGAKAQANSSVYAENSLRNVESGARNTYEKSAY